MKQLMVLAFLFLASLVNAQDKTSLKDIDKLTFFGVDFSMAKSMVPMRRRNSLKMLSTE